MDKTRAEFGAWFAGATKGVDLAREPRLRKAIRGFALAAWLHQEARAALRSGGAAVPVGEIASSVLREVTWYGAVPSLGTKLYAGEATAEPPGWKLVPVEPTAEMEEAGGGACAWDSEMFGGEIDKAVIDIYRAMLAAAPAPATKDDGASSVGGEPDRQPLASDGSGDAKDAEPVECPHAWAAGSGGFRHCMECGRKETIIDGIWRPIRRERP